ncbi:hypothetical protein J2Z22_003947 [Paenibacillus forsythiae]|uniref:Phosphatase n=1 Tax=Paenibacillus forsythiae TaxID=365616 RepID=A0ABU3HF74_9BACL|nr:hypothetical protein [Paenibacillus forsythiae]MDT3428355.1 hypothetical protein [Paenibacillus forsythiae]
MMKKLAISLVVVFLLASGTTVLASGAGYRGGSAVQPLDHGYGG